MTVKQMGPPAHARRPPFCQITSSSVGVDGLQRHQACQNEVAVDLRQRRPSVEQISRIGMDTSKHIFQLHGVNTAEEPVLRKKLRRKEMVAFFEKLQPMDEPVAVCPNAPAPNSVLTPTPPKSQNPCAELLVRLPAMVERLVEPPPENVVNLPRTAPA